MTNGGDDQSEATRGGGRGGGEGGEGDGRRTRKGKESRGRKW